MFRLLNIKRKLILFACCLVGLIAVAALTFSVKTNSQQLKVLNQKDKSELLKKVENSPEQQLKIARINDSPLQITGATVKEISGSEFTKLTEKNTDLENLISRPEVNLTNTSDKTVTEFAVAIGDPKARKNRVFTQRKVSIAPGESYSLTRENLTKPEIQIISDENGTRRELMPTKANSDKYWLDFARLSDVVIAVGQVGFKDGSKWTMKEGDELR